MRANRIEVRLFAEASFSAYSRQLLSEAISRIQSEEPDYLLNVNESEYLAHLESKYSLETIKFHLDNISMDAQEKMVPAERFPPYQFAVSRGASYKRQVFTFHLPFSGTFDLLRCQPSQSAIIPSRVLVASDEIVFEVVDMFQNGDRVNQEKEQVLKALETATTALANDVIRHNDSLRVPLRGEFDKRKAEILKQRQIAESLGVPFRGKASLPSTFSVPVTSRKKIAPKPSASSEPYRQEPTLNESIYVDILQVIEDAGRVIERHPSLHQGKDEEGLTAR
jgi:hypothetical protein